MINAITRHMRENHNGKTCMWNHGYPPHPNKATLRFMAREMHYSFIVAAIAAN